MSGRVSARAQSTLAADNVSVFLFFLFFDTLMWKAIFQYFFYLSRFIWLFVSFIFLTDAIQIYIYKQTIETDEKHTNLLLLIVKHSFIAHSIEIKPSKHFNMKYAVDVVVSVLAMKQWSYES